MTRTRRQIKEEQIVISAKRIFSDKGFSKSSIQEIADDAIVGKGTVYEYFSSKEKLFVAAYENEAESFIDAMSNVIGSKIALQDKMNAIIDFIMEDAEEKERSMKQLIHNSIGDLTVESRKEILQIYSQMRGALTILFKQALEEALQQNVIRTMDLTFASKALVNYIFSFSMVVGTDCEFASREERLKERRLLLDIILNGILLPQ